MTEEELRADVARFEAERDRLRAQATAAEAEARVQSTRPGSDPFGAPTSDAWLHEIVDRANLHSSDEGSRYRDALAVVAAPLRASLDHWEPAFADKRRRGIAADTELLAAAERAGSELATATAHLDDRAHASGAAAASFAEIQQLTARREAALKRDSEATAAARHLSHTTLTARAEQLERDIAKSRELRTQAILRDVARELPRAIAQSMVATEQKRATLTGTDANAARAIAIRSRGRKS